MNNSGTLKAGVGTVAVVPFGFGIGLKNGIAGKHPAMLIDGIVYVHHHHIAAQLMSGVTPRPNDGYGWAILDSDGIVVDDYWTPVGP